MHIEDVVQQQRPLYVIENKMQSHVFSCKHETHYLLTLVLYK